MKKIILAIAAGALVGLLATHAPANAETPKLTQVNISTGASGLTYNGVFGPNLAGALREFGYPVTVMTSKGSKQNLDRVAANEAQIGFTQADAYMLWRGKHPNEAANVDAIGELQKECVFLAVRDDGKIDSEDDLKAGIKLAIGKPDSGSNATWEYLSSLEPDYAKVETYAEGSDRTLSKVVTKEYDGFLWVSAKDKSNKYLKAVLAKNSGLKLVALDDWSMDNKMPNGEPIYTLEKTIVEAGWVDDTIKTTCTRSLVVGNTDEANEELLDNTASVLLTNHDRVVSAKK